MVSNKLKNLFLWSLVLTIAHGIEEVTTGFLYKDSFISYFASLGTPSEIFYWTFHIMWWLMLVVAYLLIKGKKWVLIVLSLFSIVFIFEVHHLIKFLLTAKYYPGMITGFFYPVIGVFFWKELIRNWRINYGRN